VLLLNLKPYLKDFVFKVPFREKSIKVDLKKALNPLQGLKIKI